MDKDRRQLGLANVTDDFAIGFTEQTALVWEPFGGQPLVQVEFQACLPWGLEENEPDPWSLDGENTK